MVRSLKPNLVGCGVENLKFESSRRSCLDLARASTAIDGIGR